jgi:hypothetical protein
LEKLFSNSTYFPALRHEEAYVYLRRETTNHDAVQFDEIVDDSNSFNLVKIVIQKLVICKY